MTIEMFPIIYLLIGYYWGIWAVARSLELYYSSRWYNLIIGFVMNSILWPITIIMAYRIETKLKGDKLP